MYSIGDDLDPKRDRWGCPSEEMSVDLLLDQEVAQSEAVHTRERERERERETRAEYIKFGERRPAKLSNEANLWRA